jgi:sarcosine oxidase subunit alpha
MARLTQLPTLRIEPSQPLSLTYRGRIYQGLKGDTVATALYSHGTRIFSRSIKYHRPRGLYSLDGECANCLMDVNGVPNVRAEKTLLKEGMVVSPQNVVGSPEWDLQGFMDKLSWAMPAGFYYRFFHKPYKLWPFFLSQIRRAAGIGLINPTSRLQGRFDELYLTADVCVIGGGPAGITAALAAAQQGVRVILLEARPWLGGFFDYRVPEYGQHGPLYKRARELEGSLIKEANVRVLSHAPMIGFYTNNLVTAFQVGGETDPFDERYIEVRAQSAVVATGCLERPLLFENNDRPGVMQIACAHRLARTWGLLPGTCTVFSVGHDLGLEAAVDLYDLGQDVSCVADCRTTGQDPQLLEALAERKIPVLRGWVASMAHGKTLKRVTLTTTEGGKTWDVNCDVLVASAGLTPLSGPLSLAQAKMGYDGHTGFFLPKELPPKVHAAGRVLGFHHPESIEASGRLAGLAAAADCGAPVGNVLRETQDGLSQLPGPSRGSKLIQAPGRGRKAFLCFDEDTTVKHLYQACDMGFDRVELAKRFTAAGTGPSQGGIPGHNLPFLMSEYVGDASEPELPSTVRAPLVTTLMATYSGPRRDLFKRTPLHLVQEKEGAVFRRIGAWKRARYFSRDFTCRQEIENVRNNVGIIDVSTLGKFRLFGPDALKVLQRVYVSDMARIPERRAKYSAMCNEDGCLIDDGVVIKRAENDYYFTSSTARADSTAEWIRYHTRYDDWDYSLVNLTDAFGAINLAGPNARSVLGKLTDADIASAAFPYAAYRELVLAKKIPARVMRLGFLGELSYEIHVPTSYTESLWSLLLEAGREYGIRPFGVEAQNVLRLEKGHVIIGQESEIRTTLHDLGLGFLWSRDKVEAKTVGAPALHFTEHQEGRLKLVGLEMENPYRPPKDGSIVVDLAIRGYVATARFSFPLQKAVGLALVEDHLAKPGTRLAVFEDGMGRKRLNAKVVPLPFYDPEGKRLKM